MQYSLTKIPASVSVSDIQGYSLLSSTDKQKVQALIQGGVGAAVITTPATPVPTFGFSSVTMPKSISPPRPATAPSVFQSLHQPKKRKLSESLKHLVFSTHNNEK